MYRQIHQVTRLLIDSIFPISCSHCDEGGIFSTDGLCKDCHALFLLDYLTQGMDRCDICSRPMDNSGNAFCKSCISLGYQKEYNFTNESLMLFTSRIKDTIYQAKFFHAYDYLRFWLELLSIHLKRYLKDNWHCILAPTTQKSHLMKKLARDLKRYHGINIITDGLLKYKKIEQKNLTQEERLIAQKDNIYVNKRYTRRISGKKWLVLDDIYTTGSTVYYSSAALQRYNALSVKSLTLSITIFK